MEPFYLDGSVIRPADNKTPCHKSSPKNKELESNLLILTGHALFAAQKGLSPGLFLPGYRSETHKIVKVFKYQLP